MISLRPANPQDREFLFQVYASTRSEEMAMVDWEDARKEEFLRMQFNAQDAYYREHYLGAAYWVIQVDGINAGRLYLHRQPNDLRIMDITLLPDQRGKGVGSAILLGLLAEGDQSGIPVTIHVERFNPALRLYERLGFQLAEDKGVYLFLRRNPQSLENSSTDGQQSTREQL